MEAQINFLAIFKALRPSLLAMAALSMLGTVHAQNYPNKPLRFIVTQGPGGASDILARIIARKLGDSLGQPVVVDNRAGAEGIIGTDLAAKSPPDGYTMIFTANSVMAMNPSLYKKLPYDPVKDFDPVTFLGRVTYGVFINHTVPANTLAEFIGHAKSNPGKLHYGAGGTVARIGTEMFNSAAGIKLEYVPYKSNPAAVTDLMGGQIQMMILPLASAQQAKTGKMKILAVNAPARSSQLPNVPTMIESGIPNYEFSAWTAIHVPAGTPKERIRTLNTAIARILAMPDVIEEARTAGFELQSSTPEQLTQLVKADIQRYAKVIKDLGIPLQE